MYIGNYAADSYYSVKSYATCTPCPPGDIWCGANKWFCDMGNAWEAAGKDPKNAPTAQAGIGGLDKQFQQAYPNSTKNQPAGVANARTPSSTTTSSGGGGGGGTPASKNCGGCNGGDLGCEFGKAFCEFSNFGKNWWDGMGSSISKGTGGMGLLPMIAIGGGLLLLVVVVAKR